MSTTEQTIEKLRKDFTTPALRRDQIVSILRKCGLGSLATYKKLKSNGTLKPLRKLDAGEHSRYDREQVLTLISDCLTTPD